MAQVTRAQLVDAAKDLNEVLDLDPKIDTRAPVSELKKNVGEAAQLLQETDKIKPETKTVVDALAGNGDDSSADEGEAETETAVAGEVDTAVQEKPKAERKPAPTAAKAEPAKTDGEKKVHSGGGRSYEGSFAQKMDLALQAGGTYASIAEGLGIKAAQLRAHGKFRVKSGKWKITENGDQIKMEKVETPEPANA